jgi:phosphoribosylformimino-5-aminoimidazole carboxamide ribotide isomerase
MNERLKSSILPVLVVKGGRVVRGVGGRRVEYRPLVSRVTDSTDPGFVLMALGQAFGFNRFYIADLDAICDRRSRLGDLRKAPHSGYELDIDAGIRSREDLERLLAVPGVRPVIGLESIGSRSQFEATLEGVERDRVVFSLDLMTERPIAAPDWPTSPIEIAEIAADAGIRNLIVLDLAAVGEGRGCPTLPLCREIRRRWPSVELITGGGIRDRDDIQCAIDHGVDKVLVASALHNGQLD